MSTELPPTPENPFQADFGHLPTFENGRTPVHLTAEQYARAQACWTMCEGIALHEMKGNSALVFIGTMQAELVRLNALINTPHTEDFFVGVRLESAHQHERWKSDHDVGKKPLDWYWLLSYLAGKAVAAFDAGDTEFGKHHIITTSAAMLNWHKQVSGQTGGMRPGIDPVARGISQPVGDTASAI